jgi:hypothetical protein
MVVFWNVTPFSLVDRCQNFGGPLFSLEQKRQEGWQYEDSGGTTTHRHVIREAVFVATDTQYLQPQTVYQSSAYRSETINKNTSGMDSPLSLIVTL